ncbi:helix-turn-helix domain-containing protein [Nocardia vaccinii]|uniref:helix-turn-helix domain-containing protein n=1 Tax=Nocardia vaccinii TaxID=1822 RepID=UPI00082DA1C9|nr:helix-turn-helix domain-containing protein [Nocardia vaccinii]
MFVTADVRYPLPSIGDQRQPRRDHLVPAEQAEILRICRTALTDLLRAPDEPERVADILDRLRDAVEAAASQGLSTEHCTAAMQRAARESFEQISRTTAADDDQLVATTKRFIEIREMVTATIAETSVTELRPAALTPAVPFQVIAATLGDLPAESVQHAEEIYAVLAITIVSQYNSELPGNRSHMRQRAMWGIRTALANRCELPVLSTLGDCGGTILVPSREADDAALEELIAQLSVAARTPVTATVSFAPRTALADFADHSHDLLDLVERLGYPAGLYRFADVALEYQITRPGPARDRLATILDPLDDHPQLLQTLLTHLQTNLNRRDTARLMNLHRNTIDYRLRRIEEFTGYDPLTQPGLWNLQAALIVRAYCRATTSADPAITASAAHGMTARVTHDAQ